MTKRGRRVGRTRGLGSRIVLVFLGFAAALALLTFLTLAGLDVLSSVRGFVAGESLWSKSQKQAVLALHRYADGGSEADWAAFGDAIAVPLSDRRAREELDSPSPDLEIARRGLVRGGLDPEDADGMTRLFLRFRRVSFMERSIRIWEAGDSLIAELEALGRDLRWEVVSPPPDRSRVARILARVDAVDAELTGLEEEFSRTIGEGARAVTGVLVRVLLGTAGFLVVAAGAGLRFVYVRIRERERALEQSERRFRVLFEDSRDAVYVTKRDGRFVDANQAAERLLGWTRSELLSHNAAELYLEETDRSRFQRAVESEGAVKDFEVRLRRADGEVLVCELTASVRRDDAGEVVGYQGIIRDMTERKRLESRLRERALYDPLTGLPNRRLFRDRLAHALSRARRDPERGIAVLFVDLDRFKVVNDGLGHAAGDQVLVAAARRLSASVRPADTLARFGGDEFTVLLEDLGGREEAIRIVGRLLRAFEPPFEVAGERFVLHASIGVAAGPLPPAGDVEDLVRRADVAMFRAKGAPGSAFHVFDPELDEEETRRLRRETALRRGIERGEFVLRYQPIVELATGRAVAIESLARWARPADGLLAPEEFVPLAEETGLIVPLGERLLALGCRELKAETVPSASALGLHVNLSPRQFEDPGLAESVARVLEETAFSPELLCFEVTESAVLQAPEKAGELKALGVRLVVDDFGTGYSSFTYLKHFDVDGLKIDMSFVHGLLTDARDRAIVEAVLGLCRTLEVPVIAEGVETAAQADALAQMGCTWGQGFYFSPPVSLKRALRPRSPSAPDAVDHSPASRPSRALG